MAFFRYQFRDDKGALLEGTVQAPTESAALSALQQRGHREVRVFPAIADASNQPSQLVSHNQMRHQAAQTIASPQPAPKVQPKVVRTRKGSDKERFFLFSQIGERLRAGVNPVACFEDLARYGRTSKYHDALRDMAVAGNLGYPLSSVFERYVDLFPPFNAGMIRAGEEGGFLPEAFKELGEQAHEAHRFARFHWFMWLVLINAIGAVPLSFAFRVGILAGWNAADASGGASGMAGVLAAFGQALVQVWIPAVLIVSAIALLIRWWFGRLSAMRARHRLGLRVPIYGPRSRSENVRTFCWTLSKLSKAGLHPRRSWELAADAVPNLEMRHRLMNAGVRMHEGSRLSDTIFQSELFPQEYAPVVSTGEMVGNIEGALEQLERASRDDYGVSSAKAKYRSMSFGCIGVLIVGGIWIIMFAKTMYVDLIEEVLKGFQP